MADNQPTLSDTERWAPISQYEGMYEVSDTGRVWSNYVGREMKLLTVPSGHKTVSLKGGGTRDKWFVHRLVLEVFTGPAPEGIVCRHLDGNPANNHLSNLAWGTHTENMQDALRHGTNYADCKTHCPRGHELVGDNLVPWALRNGSRTCLACARARAYVKKRGGDFVEVSHAYHASIVGK